MKTTLYALVLTAAACVPAAAQISSRYIPADETTIAGTIQQVIRLQGLFGTQVMLDTPQGMYNVALGPSWFIEWYTPLKLTPGGFLQVTGAPVRVDGWQFFVARQVEESGNTVTLRNAQGVPVWVAGRIGPAAYAGQMDPAMPPGQVPPRAPVRASRIYNPQNETTVAGTVQEINNYVCGPWAGSYAVLETPEGRINVELGPSEYLRSQGMEIKTGETLHATGSRIDLDGVEVLLARSVTAGGRTVALRTAEGVPRWASSQVCPGCTSPRTDQP